MSEELEAELEKILREAERGAAELRRELAERRRLREQHEEISRLEEHLAGSQVRWEEVRSFFEQILGELRSGAAQQDPAQEDDQEDRGEAGGLGGGTARH